MDIFQLLGVSDDARVYRQDPMDLNALLH